MKLKEKHIKVSGIHKHLLLFAGIETKSSREGYFMNMLLMELTGVSEK